METRADYAQAKHQEGYELMGRFNQQLDELDTCLNILEGRLAPILLSSGPDSEITAPVSVPMHNFHAELDRLSDRLSRLKSINDRIRL